MAVSAASSWPSSMQQRARRVQAPALAGDSRVSSSLSARASGSEVAPAGAVDGLLLQRGGMGGGLGRPSPEFTVVYERPSEYCKPNGAVFPSQKNQGARRELFPETVFEESRAAEARSRVRRMRHADSRTQGLVQHLPHAAGNGPQRGRAHARDVGRERLRAPPPNPFRSARESDRYILPRYARSVSYRGDDGRNGRRRRAATRIRTPPHTVRRQPRRRSFVTPQSSPRPGRRSIAARSCSQDGKIAAVGQTVERARRRRRDRRQRQVGDAGHHRRPFASRRLRRAGRRIAAGRQRDDEPEYRRGLRRALGLAAGSAVRPRACRRRHDDADPARLGEPLRRPQRDASRTCPRGPCRGDEVSRRALRPEDGLRRKPEARLRQHGARCRRRAWATWRGTARRGRRPTEYRDRMEALARRRARIPTSVPSATCSSRRSPACSTAQIRVQNHCYRADEMATMIDISKEFGYKIASFHHAVEAYKIRDLLAANDICASMWADWWGFKMEAFDGIRAEHRARARGGRLRDRALRQRRRHPAPQPGGRQGDARRRRDRDRHPRGRGGQVADDQPGEGARASTRRPVRSSPARTRTS